MARIRDESDPVMARTCDDSLDPWRLASVMTSSSGSRPAMTPSSDSHIPSGGMQRTGDTQRVGTRSTPDTCTALNTSIAPDLRTPAPNLAAPTRRHEPPRSSSITASEVCIPNPGLADLTLPAPARTSLLPPGAHIPSHNTSTPTQKETLCSQLSTSA